MTNEQIAREAAEKILKGGGSYYREYDADDVSSIIAQAIEQAVKEVKALASKEGKPLPTLADLSMATMGCDAAEHLADEILALRQRAVAAEAACAEWYRAAEGIASLAKFAAEYPPQLIGLKCTVCKAESEIGSTLIKHDAGCILAKPNPGQALLDERKADRERLRVTEAACAAIMQASSVSMERRIKCQAIEEIAKPVLERLRKCDEALKWYSDPATYVETAHYTASDGDLDTWYTSAITKDKGTKAREALKRHA